MGRPNQVWSTEITYLPMRTGFMFLVAIFDWYSRYVLSFGLSNTLDTVFCVEALKEALISGRPEIFNTDQGGWPSDYRKTPIRRHVKIQGDANPFDGHRIPTSMRGVAANWGKN